MASNIYCIPKVIDEFSSVAVNVNQFRDLVQIIKQVFQEGDKADPAIQAFYTQFLSDLKELKYILDNS